MPNRALLLASLACLGVAVLRAQPPQRVTGERTVIASGEWRLIGDFVRPDTSARIPVALLLNQAGGSRDAYASLARRLAARGIASLALDLRGHGASTNLGRFTPGALSRDPLIWDAEADVIAALDYLRTRSEVDTNRIGVVGASYSGEEAAEAGRLAGYVTAYALLSPGSLSQESIDAMALGHTPWLLAAAEDDRYLRDVVASVAARAPAATIMSVPGARHATDLMRDDEAFQSRLVDWLATQLLVHR